MLNIDDKLMAINILLQPDQTLIDRSKAVNARLLENFPAGYELDELHAPHITLLQRFIRGKDIDDVIAALVRVLISERPTDLAVENSRV